MKKYRPIFAALLALLFYTVTDVLIWQRIFAANSLTQYATTYHSGWFVTLLGYGLLGIFLMWGSLKDILYFLASLFIGASSGLEDVLYYVLAGKPLPDYLPWLDANPMIFHVSRAGVLSSVFFWMAVLVILYIILYVWRRDRTIKATV